MSDLTYHILSYSFYFIVVSTLAVLFGIDLIKKNKIEQNQKVNFKRIIGFILISVGAVGTIYLCFYTLWAWFGLLFSLFICGRLMVKNNKVEENKGSNPKRMIGIIFTTLIVFGLMCLVGFIILAVIGGSHLGSALQQIH